MRKIWLAIALTLGLFILGPLAFGQGSAGGGSGSAAATIDAGVLDDAGSLDAGMSVAPITVPVVLIDPAHPAQDIEVTKSAISQYGIVWGSMLVLFAIGSWIIKKNDSTHWLSQDHTLPLLVGTCGTIGAALQAHFAGGSWQAVYATLGASVFLFLQKPKPAGAPPPPPAPATT